MNSVFFSRVQSLCTERGMTPTDLVPAAGIGEGTITGWRKGSKPRISTVSKLAEFFNVSTAYLHGTTDDPIDYANMDTSGFRQPLHENLLKKHRFNVAAANKEYVDTQREEALEAMRERGNTFNNHGENYGMMGDAHAPVRIINGKEHPLSDSASELLRIFEELGTVEQAKVLIYAADIFKEQKAGGGVVNEKI